MQEKQENQKMKHLQNIDILPYFLGWAIHVPGKDFRDMSKPFDTPFDIWSIVNCMLPTKYHLPFQNNIYERFMHLRCSSNISRFGYKKRL
jgi:hypothetical protein